jgi:nitrite reductase/ring-hydroxylating ferredoxin subunit
MKTKVAELGSLPEGKGLCVKQDGASLVVIKAEGAVYAIENRCPHLNLPLGRGKVIGHEIVCRFHGSRFDIRTGENTDWVAAVAGVSLPDWSSKLLSFGKKPQGIKAYPVTIEGEGVFVEL